MRAVPLLARGADAARQDVPFRVTVIDRDGALGFVERSIQLVEVQQRAAQEDADIGPVGVQGQILPVKTDSFDRTERAVGGVGLRQ